MNEIVLKAFTAVIRPYGYVEVTPDSGIYTKAEHRITVRLVALDHDQLMLYAKGTHPEGAQRTLAVKISSDLACLRSLLRRAIALPLCPPAGPAPALGFLSDELKLTIASYLPAVRVMAMASTCHALRAPLQQASLWVGLIARDFARLPSARGIGVGQQPFVRYQMLYRHFCAGPRYRPSRSAYPPHIPVGPVGPVLSAGYGYPCGTNPYLPYGGVPPNMPTVLPPGGRGGPAPGGYDRDRQRGLDYFI